VQLGAGGVTGGGGDDDGDGGGDDEGDGEGDGSFGFDSEDLESENFN
jgi:hypothetical protein